MYEVVCVLCAVKLEEKASRMYVQDRTSFSTKDELKNVPISANEVLTSQTRLIKLVVWWCEK